MKYKHFVLFSIFIATCIYLSKRFYNYYSPAYPKIAYSTSIHKDDTIRIAFIGDSWAAGHKNHQCSIQKLIKNATYRPVSISSYGIGGLTSKEIYNGMFEIDMFKNFIKQGYNYCIISAGINDSSKKLSTSYYKKSMDCIISFFITNDIHPIVLEIPNYNIKSVYETEKTYTKIVRDLSMFINGLSTDCKQTYRKALNELIKEKGYEDKISIIHYKSWNDDYENDLIELYNSDQVHLNEKGYIKLDSVIAERIIENSIN